MARAVAKPSRRSFHPSHYHEQSGMVNESSKYITTHLMILQVRECRELNYGRSGMANVLSHFHSSLRASTYRSTSLSFSQTSVMQQYKSSSTAVDCNSLEISARRPLLLCSQPPSRTGEGDSFNETDGQQDNAVAFQLMTTKQLQRQHHRL